MTPKKVNHATPACNLGFHAAEIATDNVPHRGQAALSETGVPVQVIGVAKGRAIPKHVTPSGRIHPFRHTHELDYISSEIAKLGGALRFSFRLRRSPLKIGRRCEIAIGMGEASFDGWAIR